MTRNDIYDYAHQHGHEILFTALAEIDALSVEVDGQCFIGLDTMTPETDEKRTDCA